MSFSGTKGYITKPKPGVMLNPLHPLSRGLVGYWLFNEGSGSLAYDISGKGNPGTLTNMSPNAQNSGWGDLVFGGGLKFDGVTDYVSLSKNIYLNSSFSVCCWVNVTAWDEDNAIIIARTRGIDWKSNYYLNIKTANQQFQVGFYDSVGSTWREVQSNTGKSTGVLFFVVGTWNASDEKLRIYINGILETTSAQFVGAIPNDAGSTVIGRFVDGATAQNELNGAIGLSYIYDYALPTQEVKQLYQDPFCNLLQVPIRRYSVAAPPVGVIMNQFQKANIGADLWNGTIIL